MRRQCKGINHHGKPCQSNPTTGSDYCFFHDPKKTKERKIAVLRGGLQGRRKTLARQVDDIEIASAADVVSLMSETISQVRRGDIDAKIANAVGYLAGIALKAIEQGDVEQRLQRIEKTLSEGGMYNGAQIRATH